ncbi:DMT family transporter [Patescibacteria group bacterium]|nr:DMT family transporter [Patescibacteria group bacterium]
MRMSTWLVLTLSAVVLWSAAQILVKKGFSHISPLWNNIFSNFFKLVIWLPVVLVISRFHLNLPSPVNLLVIVVVAVCNLFFLYAISKGELALTSTLVATSPVVTTVLSLIFLHETMRLHQGLGVVLVILAGLLLTLPVGRPRRSVTGSHWVVWGTLTALALGASDFLAKLSTNWIGAPSHLFFLAIVLQLVSVFNYLIDRPGRALPALSRSNFLPTILGTVILWVGSLLYFLAFDHGPVSLIAPVASTYTILTVTLAVIFLKEKFSLRQGIGIGLAVVEVILISA